MIIRGYISVRVDHLSKAKRGGFLVYYKSYLPLKLIDVKYLDECINFELRVGEKICKFLFLYRSPSQNRHESENFLENFELSINHMADKIIWLLFLEILM